jgi:hypothetical protein
MVNYYLIVKKKGNFVQKLRITYHIRVPLRFVRKYTLRKLLKIPDVQVFIDCMKILILAETFKLDYSYVVSEIRENKKLKKLMGLINQL